MHVVQKQQNKPTSTLLQAHTFAKMLSTKWMILVCPMIMLYIETIATVYDLDVSIVSLVQHITTFEFSISDSDLETGDMSHTTQ